MDRLTKAELVNGFPVCYPNNCSGLPEFVTKGNPYRNIVERLKAYEGLEEQGNLLKLPCAVGDTVYTNHSMKGWYFREKGRPYAAEVVFIGINSTGGFINVEIGAGHMTQFQISDLGKRFFLTREEAKAALKELERGKGE